MWAGDENVRNGINLRQRTRLFATHKNDDSGKKRADITKL